jgi:Uncharacterised nucleotidyltransferase
MPDNLATTSTRLLLGALHPEQTPSEWESACVEHQVNWDDLVIRAIVFGLAPQLYHRLESWQLDIPSRAKAKLKVTYQAQVRRNEAIYEQLGEVLAACRSAALSPIALKGVHLAACYYPEPALRPMNDIDLLFKPEELPTAEKVLSSLDYGGKHKSAEMGAGVTKHTSTYRREGEEAQTPNPYLSADAGRMVEPHLSLEESWFGLKVNVTPGVWERAETADLQGHSCLVLSPEDLLLHLCVHFCFHLIMGAPSMVQLTDLLIVSQAGIIDWATFTNRAQAQKAAPFALAALNLAVRLLNAAVPETVLAALSQATSPRLRSYILNLNLEHILKRTQQKPLTSLPQRLKRGLLDRAETARWADSLYGRWQVWRTLLAVGRTDTGQMLMGKTPKK